jgi:uncharacterized protein YkwD
MPTNLFDANFDQSANPDIQGLKNAQTGLNCLHYVLNEPSANLAFDYTTDNAHPDFNHQYQPTFNSEFSNNNDHLTGLNNEHIVDAWNSSTTNRLASPQTVTPESTTPATTDNSFIQRVVDLTNQQRLQYGLQPLQLNLKLANIAQAHSEDMAVHDYFSHTGLDNSSPGDRAQSAGYQYSYVGENIAAGYTTPEQVVQGFMNSPEHRANILNPNYHDIGVGYYNLTNDTGNVNYHSYWTEDFGKVLA